MLGHLYQRPIVSVAEVQELTGTTYTTANNLVSQRVELGVLVEATGYRRNRRFRYQANIELFGERAMRRKEWWPDRGAEAVCGVQGFGVDATEVAGSR